MSDDSAVERRRDDALDKATEEYLRGIAADANPDIDVIAEKYGLQHHELQHLASNYRCVVDILAPDSHRPGREPPSVVKRFADYELDGEPVGRGGMGVVYKARQVGLDRPVAIKLILAGNLATPAERSRFLQEARLAASMRHPNIVTIHDVGQVEGQLYYSMDFLAGPTLDELVAQRGPLPSDEAARLVQVAAEAVHAANEMGVIHRDLKPSNVILDDQGEPHVTDFGLAKQLVGDPNATKTFGFAGTAAYASPEQIAAGSTAVDRRADVYGLGAILFKLLTTHPPFQGASLADVCRMVVAEEPRSPRSLNASIKHDLATVCMKCLAKAPSRRYPTALALADDLGRCLRGDPIAARPPSVAEKAWRWCRRNRGWAAAIAAATLAVIALTIGGYRLSTALAESRTRELLLQLRSIDHSDGWAERKWAVVDAASRESRDAALRNQATLTLAGVDAQKVKSFQFGANHAIFSADGNALVMSAVADEEPPRRCIVIWNALDDETVEIPSHRDGPVAFWGGDAPVQLAASDDGAKLSLFDVRTQEELRRYIVPGDWRIVPTVPPGIAARGDIVACVIANSSQQAHLGVWNGQSGEFLSSIPCGASEDSEQSPTVVRVSDDGARIAVGRADGRISVYLPGSKKSIADLGERRNRIHGLALTSSGQKVLSGASDSAEAHWLLASADAGGRVVVWDVETKAPLTYCRGSHHAVHAVAFSPDGMTLASCGRGTSKLWDLATGRLLLDVSANDNASCLAFSPDGRRLAIGSEKLFSTGEVSVWDLQSNRGICELRGLEAEVSKLCLSKDGRFVAALAHDWRIAVWDALGPRLLHILDAPAGSSADNAALTFNDDASELAYSSGTNAMLIDVSSGAPIDSWALPPGLCDVLVFSSAERLLSFRAERSGEGWRLRIRDLIAAAPLEPLAEIGDFAGGVLGAAAISNCDWFIAEGVGGANGRDRSIRIYDSFGRLVRSIDTQFHGGYAWIVPDPIGEQVALLTRPGKQGTSLYNVQHGGLAGPTVTNPICISPRAKFVVAPCAPPIGDGGITLYAADLTPLATFDVQSPPTYVAAFDASGRILAWGKRDGTVCISFLDEVKHKLDGVGLGWQSLTPKASSP